MISKRPKSKRSQSCTRSLNKLKPHNVIQSDELNISKGNSLKEQNITKPQSSRSKTSASNPKLPRNARILRNNNPSKTNQEVKSNTIQSNNQKSSQQETKIANSVMNDSELEKTTKQQKPKLPTNPQNTKPTPLNSPKNDKEKLESTENTKKGTRTSPNTFSYSTKNTKTNSIKSPRSQREIKNTDKISKEEEIKQTFNKTQIYRSKTSIDTQKQNTSRKSTQSSFKTVSPRTKPNQKSTNTKTNPNSRPKQTKENEIDKETKEIPTDKNSNENSIGITDNINESKLSSNNNELNESTKPKDTTNINEEHDKKTNSQFKKFSSSSSLKHIPKKLETKKITPSKGNRLTQSSRNVKKEPLRSPRPQSENKINNHKSDEEKEKEIVEPVISKQPNKAFKQKIKDKQISTQTNKQDLNDSENNLNQTASNSDQTKTQTPKSISTTTYTRRKSSVQNSTISKITHTKRTPSPSKTSSIKVELIEPEKLAVGNNENKQVQMDESFSKRIKDDIDFLKLVCTNYLDIQKELDNSVNKKKQELDEIKDEYISFSVRKDDYEMQIASMKEFYNEA